MCYVVAVVEKICAQGHIRRVTACWRHCRKQAAHSDLEDAWNSICHEYKNPESIKHMFLIDYLARQDGAASPTTCSTCIRIESDPDYQKNLEQRYRYQEAESQHRTSADQAQKFFIETYIDHERGHSNPSGVRADRDTQIHNEREHANYQDLLERLADQRNEIRAFYHKQNKVYKLEQALENLNVGTKIFFGRPKTAERNAKPDYPRHWPELNPEEYPFEYYTDQPRE